MSAPSEVINNPQVDALVQGVVARRDEIQAQVAPLNEELEGLNEMLARIRGESPAKAPTKNGTTRQRRSRPGGRKAEFLRLVQENPGARVADLNKRMEGKIKPNYLYRLAKDLTDEGKIRKEGKVYFPVETEPAQPATEETPAS